MISQGEIWSVDLNPVRGHEQAGRRPVLVISVDGLNQGPAALAIVLPITTRQREIATRVAIEPPEGGLPERSFVICEQVRTISTERFGDRSGRVKRDTLERAVRMVWLLTRVP